MKSLITGASGYLGQRLAMKLAENGEMVHALIRNPLAAKNLNHPNIKIFFGDIMDIKSIGKAMEECHAVFHVAALARVWAKDPNDFYRTNVDGTINMIKVSREMDISKFILTTSTGTIGPSLTFPNDETTTRWSSFSNEYETSKYLAEEELLRATKLGFPGVIVLPTRIFGPGVLSPSSGINRVIVGFNKKRIAIIPQKNQYLGNYGYIDDIVNGHILARDKGEIGEKYILGGENISMGHLFEVIKERTPKWGLMVKIPYWPMEFFSWMSQFLAERFRIDPKITPDFVKKLNQNSAFDCTKAITQLGYKITPFEQAMESTIQFLSYQN